MKYYGYKKEQIDRVISLLNTISVTGLNQIDSFCEATTILRHTKEINVKEEGEQDVVPGNK